MNGSVQFIAQVAVVLLAARGMGHLFRRYLKQPSVLGELVAGMLIGPFALGGVRFGGIRVLGSRILEFGPFFPEAGGPLPISGELYALSLIGSVVLLFVAGLETDLDVFLRYSLAGVTTAIGGALIAFCAADALVVWFGLAESYTSPAALMMGTISLATSVGLTVAVLSELRRLDQPEGATILSAAVLDDVFGLIVLAVVLSIVAVRSKGNLNGSEDLHVLGVILKAAIFWIVAMAVGILGRRPLRRLLRSFGSGGNMATIALGLALLIAALAEEFGLALIIGAYTTGLALSRLDMAHEIQRRMAPLYDFLVPVFFCVSGMMVDFRSLSGVLVFGILFTVVAIASKILGCAAGAYPLGFNWLGVVRIGLGMTPRQEVALIVAGVALANGAITKDLYSAGVLMTVVASVITPPALKLAFNERSGLRVAKRDAHRPTQKFHIKLPGPEVAELVADRLARAFQQEEFYIHMREDVSLYELRKEEIVIFMQQRDSVIELRATPSDLEYARFVVLEEILALGDVFRDASRIVEMEGLKRELLGSPA